MNVDLKGLTVRERRKERRNSDNRGAGEDIVQENVVVM
jgi:hypothetical protein